MNFNPFNKKYFSTPRSALISAIITFEYASGVLWFFFVVILGGLTLEQIALLTVILGILGAIVGTLMWATVYNPTIKNLQKQLTNERTGQVNNNHNPDEVPLYIKNIFDKKCLFTPKATFIYSLFVSERILIIVWLLAVAVIYISGILTWTLAGISVVVTVVGGIVLGLIVWEKLYEPLRKKIEKQKTEQRDVAANHA